MAAYAPFVATETDGYKPILDGNLLYGFIAAAVLFFCLKKWVSADAGLLAALLFFMPRMMCDEQVQLGVNDLIPMILLLLALYWIDRRFCCGLLVGLAISAKLLPGLMWVAICLPPADRRKYFGGILCGLLPCLPFLIWDPAAMVRNIFVFLYLRVPDYTSPLYHAGRGAIACAELPALALAGWIVLRNRRSDLPVLRRCADGVALPIALLLGSATVHPNYFLWWFVPFIAWTAAWVFQPATYEWLG